MLALLLAPDASLASTSADCANSSAEQRDTATSLIEQSYRNNDADRGRLRKLPKAIRDPSRSETLNAKAQVG